MRIVNLLPHGPVDYRATHYLQQQLHQRISQGNDPDTLVVLEHEHTYTAGRSTKATDIRNPNIQVETVDRGGRITYHGPGQLVLYPIFRAKEPIDVVAYVRALERGVSRALWHSYRLSTQTVTGRSGVWIAATDQKPERKICAIGVKFARQTTMHGLALNLTTDLRYFDEIVPCGISDAGVTSAAAEGIELPTDALTQCARELVPTVIEEIAPLREQHRITNLQFLNTAETKELLKQMQVKAENGNE